MLGTLGDVVVVVVVVVVDFVVVARRRFLLMFCNFVGNSVEALALNAKMRVN